MSHLTIAYLVACTIWILFEVSFAIFHRSPNNKEDRGSLAFLWITIIISTGLGNTISQMGFGFYSLPVIISWIGLAMIPGGIIVRLLAMRTLGKYFTVNVATSSDQKVIDTGIYKRIRHPAYLGSLFSFLGMGIALSNWISLCVIFAPVALAFMYRIKIEEKALINSLGQTYIEYMGRTGKFIPFIK